VLSTHCTAAGSASKVYGPSSRQRIPKKRENSAKSISRTGISSAESDQKLVVRGSNDVCCPSPSKTTSVGDTDRTRTSALGIKSANSKETKQRVVACVCQFLNISNASSDESFFLLLVWNFGFKLATFLAAKFRLQCQRPSQALLAMMNVDGRNYSARNAKHKPPSGAGASEKAFVNRVNRRICILMVRV